MRKFYLIGLVAFVVCISSGAEKRERQFIKRYEPLLKIPTPRILTNSISYSGSYAVERIIDGNPRTEYSSRGDGTNTFIEFDFGAAFKIAAFRHTDRNDPATVAESELVFKDTQDKVISKARIVHVNKRGGETFYILPQVVTARRVRWQVTKLGPQNFGTVGGAEIEFFEPGAPQEVPLKTTIKPEVLPMVEIKDGVRTRTLKLKVDYPYALNASAFLRIEGLETVENRIVELKPGASVFEFSIPETFTKKLVVSLESEGVEITKQKVEAEKPPVKEIYILPHSHVDIGYTAVQPDVVKKQNENIDIAIELIRKTANYPDGSKFVWNVEVLWPVENYLREASTEKQKEFIKFIKEGRIGLDAFYGNILTGLSRPEELIRMMGYAMKVSEMWGVKVESAMISDVPGYTWSTVTAMAQAGVRYFSFAPNYFDRMGGTMITWQDKPFWWIAPDGVNKVLCWCPTRGYALGHLIGHGEALARFLPQYLNELREKQYPYEITYIRWNVHGDNGAPDEQLSDVVRAWNERYAEPRLIIATTAEAFRKFEQKYGKSLPQYRGDYTPYWEDGAGSSAFETAMNRASAERLVQAETLWAIRNLKNFDVNAFYNGWRNVLLYSEHTWGAHNSVSEPDKPFVKEQWRIKRGFAVEADEVSKKLFERAIAIKGEVIESAIDVYNTVSWFRTELVTVPKEIAQQYSAVFDDSGKSILCQKLASGEIVFVAEKVPPFGAKRYKLGNSENTPSSKGLLVKPNKIEHPLFTIGVDDESGAIVSLISKLNGKEYVDARAKTAINDYFYLIGADVRKVQRTGKTKITVKENGPLVGSLLIESEAPGCKRLLREVRVVNGLDKIELINTVEKLPIRKKEGVHFGFGFDVEKATVRMDVGLATVRPNIDQIPAACKNWFSVQRWVDISNEKHGITMAPVDAPLLEVGDITANLIGSQTDPKAWITNLAPSSVIYSWVMNNHWHTNYRAEQDDTVIFRYIMRLHDGYSSVEATRFGVEASQPLVVARASGATPPKPRVLIDADDVVATTLKPSDDGKALVLRLFGAGGRATNVKLFWNDPKPKNIWLSGTGEKPLKKVGDTVQVPPWGVVTLRADVE
ncbi:MAG: glycoside hydrolase [Verrucomicrobiae bacterium]|nr:glycoside hydrolase [Verrucomicrobiae bacterium]